MDKKQIVDDYLITVSLILEAFNCEYFILSKSEETGVFQSGCITPDSLLNTVLLLLYKGITTTNPLTDPSEIVGSIKDRVAMTLEMIAVTEEQNI